MVTVPRMLVVVAMPTVGRVIHVLWFVFRVRTVTLTLAAVMSTKRGLGVHDDCFARGVNVVRIGLAARRGLPGFRTVAVTVGLVMGRAHRCSPSVELLILTTDKHTP